MSYREIYFFIEGSDDERFISTIVKPVINKEYQCFSYQYSGKSTQKIKDFLKSVKAMNFADYFFLRDINLSPCVTEKKQALKKKYKPRLDESKIIIVIKEIESWYLAGLNDKACNILGIKPRSNTDDITKEQFIKIIPKRFDSKIDFMAEVLQKFSIGTAKKKSKSFSYFMDKLEKV